MVLDSVSIIAPSVSPEPFRFCGWVDRGGVFTRHCFGGCRKGVALLKLFLVPCWSPEANHRRVFAIPLILHILLAAVAIWGARNNYRVIVAVVLNDFYHIEPRLRQNGFWSWCWTFAVAIFDYYLIKGLRYLVYDFITGHLWLRLRYGFLETEVVLRIPSNAAWHWQKLSLLRATSHRFLVGNTGYNTRCAPWELCYTASAEAYHLANEGVFDLKNWESSMWHRNRHSQWTVLKVRTPSRTLNILQEKLQSLGKDEFFAPILQKSAADVAPDAKTMEDFSKTIENIFQEEGLNLRELWTEAETEEERSLNQPLFQLYFP